MKTVRLLAGALFYLCRVLGTLFLLTGLYASIILLLAYFRDANGLPLHIEGNYFKIYYPFTQTTFLLGDYTSSYIITALLTILLYGLFLWLLGSVFDSFRQKKLFTHKGVSRLTRFYLINILVPVIFFVTMLAFNSDTGDIIRISLLHLVIGVFAFFMSAIFKQGLILQNEQDLTF